MLPFLEQFCVREKLNKSRELRSTALASGLVDHGKGAVILFANSD